jgi:NADH dehydrogenase
MELMLARIGRRRALVSVPFWLAGFQARFLELVPGKPLTRDQVELLKRDNVASTGAATLADLGITPTALELILPAYLDRFCKGGRFHGGPHGEKLYS